MHTQHNFSAIEFFSCEIQHERVWRHPLVEQSELLENDDSAAATHIACSRQMFLSPITFETIKLQLSLLLGVKSIWEGNKTFYVSPYNILISLLPVNEGNKMGTDIHEHSRSLITYAPIYL